MNGAVGVDLSLTATGLAVASGETMVLRSKLTGVERLIEISDRVLGEIMPGELAVIEGYSMGSKGSAVHALAELGGVVRYLLTLHGLTYLIVPPAKLKRFATGKGNADKATVLKAAWQRLGFEGTDHNEADALWLRAIGLELLGTPVVPMPKTHRSALDGMETPA